MVKKYEVAVNLQQDFTAAEQAQGRNNIEACYNASIAPAYTSKTYEANSYVMHDGILYTNENVIAVAENWTPAHWTQTTVAEMMASAGAAKWTNRTAVVSINGGQTEQVDIQDHEYVTLIANKSTGSGTCLLNVRLHGECYISLVKGDYVSVITYVGDSSTTTTNVNTGIPYIDTTDTTVVVPSSCDIPDEYDPDAFTTANVIDDVSMSFDKPLLTDGLSKMALLHYLGEGTLIITPLPN